jgi:hypothetical protein
MNFRKLATLVIVLSCAASLAAAGEVFGKIVEGAAPVGDAASVQVKCGEKSYPPVKTDKSGSYRMVVAETGKCTMTVNYKQKSADIAIASYDEAAQIDIVVEMKDGNLSVRRK